LSISKKKSDIKLCKKAQESGDEVFSAATATGGMMDVIDND